MSISLPSLELTPYNELFQTVRAIVRGNYEHNLPPLRARNLLEICFIHPEIADSMEHRVALLELLRECNPETLIFWEFQTTHILRSAPELGIGRTKIIF